MALTPEEELTVKTYDAMAEQWASGHSGVGFWTNELTTFRRLLPSGKVVEIGSGGGRDAAELIAAGYEYVGTDISQGLLNVARERNTGARFIHASVYDLDFPANSFDGFWASASLLHIPKARMDEALSSIHSVVRTEGVGFISLKQGDGERVVEEDAHLPMQFRRLFAFYQQPELEQVFHRNGFEVIEHSVRPMSEKTTWLVNFVRKVKS